MISGDQKEVTLFRRAFRENYFLKELFKKKKKDRDLGSEKTCRLVVQEQPLVSVLPKKLFIIVSVPSS